MEPRIILLFSGKRKCGKDYLTDKLQNSLPDRCETIKISAPIKSHWAKVKNLSLHELMGDGPLKELYRKEMIKWSDEMRQKDYGCFCRLACSSATGKPIWIVSDVRRKNDILWFKETYGDRVKTIRIEADEHTRMKRGYTFVVGVDDVASECDLDDYTAWDLVVNNGETAESLGKQLEQIKCLMDDL